MRRRVGTAWPSARGCCLVRRRTYLPMAAMGDRLLGEAGQEGTHVRIFTLDGGEIAPAEIWWSATKQWTNMVIPMSMGSI